MPCQRRPAALILCLLLLAPACLAAQVGSTTWRARSRWSGSLETEWAPALDADGGHKLEVSFESHLEVRLGDATSLTTIVRTRADVYDELVPGRPGRGTSSAWSQSLAPGDHGELELRELYVQTKVGRSYLRVGKQQIVWGQADGLKVLDVVNPQEFREFILDDLDDSRIPLWSVNAEIPLGGVNLELLWVPDPSVHHMPRAPAAFAFSSPRLVPQLPPGVPVRLETPSPPAMTWRGSDLGGRASAFVGGWDLSLAYLYHRDDFPVLSRSLMASGAEETTLVLVPQHYRNHLVGATFSNAVGQLTLRGEIGYTVDRALATSDLQDADGVVRNGELSSVIGLDWAGFRDWLLSLQLFQTRLPNRNAQILSPESRSTVTLLLRRNLWNDTLRLESLMLHDPDVGDGLVRLQWHQSLASNLELTLGIDVFYGTPEGIFGQFDSQDRTRVGLRWSF